MKTKLFVCGLMLAVTVLGASESKAQYPEDRETKAVPNDYYVQPPSPKLGVMVEAGFDYVQVTDVFAGSPAARLGLEPGDRILEINGRPCRSPDEMGYLLRLAARDNRGQIRVLIDNVRARYGEFGAERFINRRTWLEGYEAYFQEGGGKIYASGNGG
ncbi:MAG: PDZ domain-containing protein [Planctomycetota bacterium]